MGNQSQFKQAKQALDLALLLRPRYLPAWSSMALVAFNMQGCKAAIFWADKVLSYQPDLNSKDPWERGAALSMTDAGEKLAAEALGEAEMIGSWKQLKEVMKEIKDACRK